MAKYWDVSPSGSRDDLWMTDGIQTVLVDIRIEGCKVVVDNLLVSLGLVIELDRVRAPAAESITGVERRDTFQFVNKVTYS